MDFEKTLGEAIAKTIELIDAGKIKQAKEMLNKIKDIIDNLVAVGTLLSEE